MSKDNKTRANFYRLSQEEQRAIFASAMDKATDEEMKALMTQSRIINNLKLSLISKVNDILGTDYDAIDKVIFTQTGNDRIEVSTNYETNQAN